MIQLKYKEISNFGFSQAMQKITSTPVHGKTAALIHKVTRQLELVRERITKEFQDELVHTFAKKDEKGEVIRPEGEPNGFEPIEEKQEEFMKAHEAFGDRMADIDASPFTVDTLEGIKVSAQDLAALKDLYIGNRADAGKPPLPSNVASLR